MPSKSCEICGAEFYFKPYRAETARFCSGTCRAKWVATLPNSPCRGGVPRPRMLGNKLRAGLRPSNAFPSGHRPWNADLKGIHLSAETEFKPGPRPDMRAEIGSVKLRTNRRGKGSTRAFVKIANPNVWKLRAVVVWTTAKGPVPTGSVIHHVDRNTLNDAIENLECLTRSEHAREHASEVRAARWPDRP